MSSKMIVLTVVRWCWSRHRHAGCGGRPASRWCSGRLTPRNMMSRKSESYDRGEDRIESTTAHRMRVALAAVQTGIDIYLGTQFTTVWPERHGSGWTTEGPRLGG